VGRAIFKMRLSGTAPQAAGILFLCLVLMAARTLGQTYGGRDSPVGDDVWVSCNPNGGSLGQAANPEATACVLDKHTAIYTHNPHKVSMHRCSQASSRTDHSFNLLTCNLLLTRTFFLSVTPTLRDRAGAQTAYLWAKGESVHRNTQLPLARTLPRWRTLNRATTGCSLRKTCSHSKDTVIWRGKAEGGSCARQHNMGGTSHQRLKLEVCLSAAMVTGATAEMCLSTRCVTLGHFFSFPLINLFRVPLSLSLRWATRHAIASTTFHHPRSAVAP